MTASKLSTRLLTLALAAGPVACSQSPAAAQDKDAPQPAQVAPVAPGAPAVPGQPPVAPPEPPKPVERPERPDTKKFRTTTPAAVSAFGGGGSSKQRPGEPFGGFTPAMVRAYSLASETTTAVIGTSPITREAQDEWREDLNVMDRLLRQSVSDPDGDGPMGLKIFSSSSRLSPIYVEGAGVILSATVPWPLAPSTEKENAGEGQRERPSRWAQVRREVRGEPMPDGADRRRLPFDAARIDALTSAVMTVLPEASNFRHLKPTESVFVTISGISEDGAAMRITFKASKADIDEAAKGTIDAEAFKQRVSKRIG